MSEYYSSPRPPKRAKWKRWQKIVLGVSLILIGFICCGAGLSSALSGKDHKAVPSIGKTIDPPVTDTSGAAEPVAAPVKTKHGLTAKDVHLTVKTVTKDCYGSAGCNVQYKIEAGWSPDNVECDVTYDVKGLEDTQTGTLNLHADGTFEQNSYQFGSTSSSSRKLTAKVTAVDCDVLR